MTNHQNSLRTPLGRARGLGSAKHGTAHWWGQQVTSLALIPLVIYTVVTFFAEVVMAGGGFGVAQAWLAHPVNTFVMILTIVVAAHHGLSGLQVIMEDYIHHKVLNFIALMAARFVAVTMALAGVLAIIKTWINYV